MTEERLARLLTRVLRESAPEEECYIDGEPEWLTVDGKIDMGVFARNLAEELLREGIAV